MFLAYPGSRPDLTEFADVGIADRLGRLCVRQPESDPADITSPEDRRDAYATDSARITEFADFGIADQPWPTRPTSVGRSPPENPPCSDSAPNLPTSPTSKNTHIAQTRQDRSLPVYSQSGLFRRTWFKVLQTRIPRRIPMCLVGKTRTARPDFFQKRVSPLVRASSGPGDIT